METETVYQSVFFYSLCGTLFLVSVGTATIKASDCIYRCLYGPRLELEQPIVAPIRRITLHTTVIPEVTESDSDSSSSKESDMCVICIEPLQSKQTTIILDCNHIYHKNCILDWFNKELTCPMCRKPVE